MPFNFGGTNGFREQLGAMRGQAQEARDAPDAGAAEQAAGGQPRAKGNLFSRMKQQIEARKAAPQMSTGLTVDPNFAQRTDGVNAPGGLVQGPAEAPVRRGNGCTQHNQ